jgi:hypothetical protein
MIKNLTIYATIMLILFLSSCSMGNYTQKPVGLNGCIPPLTESDFPLGVRVESKYFEEPPDLPWKMIAEVPEGNRSTVPVLSRESDTGEHEIWFVSKWAGIENKRKQRYVDYILIYHVEKNQWEEIDNYLEVSNAQIFNVYELPNGVVIADGFSQNNHVMAKFDEEKRTFTEDKRLNDLPDGPLLYDESRQIFWAFVPKDGIYSVDPNTGQDRFWVSVPYLDVDTFPVDRTAVIDKNGDIYILSNNDVMANALYKFSPQTNSFSYKYNFVRDYYEYPPSTLFLTGDGHLWVEDMGWLDIDEDTWHLVIRSSVFVAIQPEDGYNYSWPFGDPMYESSNGYIWFNAANGVIYHDPQHGNWCWVTTDYSSVIEDVDSNMWMVAYGKLYMWEINP